MDKKQSYENQYKSGCDYIIEKLNENITDGGYFSYFINRDGVIILENKNRLGIVNDFSDFRIFYHYLLGITQFFNLRYNDFIEFEKKHAI